MPTLPSRDPERFSDVHVLRRKKRSADKPARKRINWTVPVVFFAAVGAVLFGAPEEVFDWTLIGLAAAFLLGVATLAWARR